MKKQAFFLFFILLLGSTFYSHTTANADYTPQEYTNIDPDSYSKKAQNASYFFYPESIENIKSDPRKLSEVDREKWFGEMKALGRRMESAGVRSVYFVPGTFASYDPVGFISFIKMLYLELSKRPENLDRFTKPK